MPLPNSPQKRSTDRQIIGCAGRVARGSPPRTFLGFTREDHALAEMRCELEEAEIITTGRVGGIWPSDHYPVRAIVTLKPQRDD